MVLGGALMDDRDRGGGPAPERLTSPLSLVSRSTATLPLTRGQVFRQGHRADGFPDHQGADLTGIGLAGGTVRLISGAFGGWPAAGGSGMRTSSQVWTRSLPKWIATVLTSCVRLARVVVKTVSLLSPIRHATFWVDLIDLAGDGLGVSG